MMYTSEFAVVSCPANITMNKFPVISLFLRPVSLAELSRNDSKSTWDFVEEVVLFVTILFKHPPSAFIFALIGPVELRPKALGRVTSFKKLVR